MESELRQHAQSIFAAAIAAVRPEPLIERFIAANADLHSGIDHARQIVVVGGGKAGAGMVIGVEQALANDLNRLIGIVNVPDDAVRPTQRIVLNASRSIGRNEPTQAAVAGVDRMLSLINAATPDDIVLCLLSGGGSALVPAPVTGISLDEKLAVTRELSEAGATINDLNCVRKHLSQIKGGGLAAASHAGALWSLIISDVIGDPLDVIASGPTAPDPTTYHDALEVLKRFDLSGNVPTSIRQHLQAGANGAFPETPKILPETVHNLIVANNATALAAAAVEAKRLGYRVHNFGDRICGESAQVAREFADIVRSVRSQRRPVAPPCCLLIGGETTVTLPRMHGQGGRNQEFVLSLAAALSEVELRDMVILSGGTDGEDGPTDAAGAIADHDTLQMAAGLGLDPGNFVQKHDSYTFFFKTGGLLITGLTGTNVMDVRIILCRS